ncbi:hypothetical protein CEXT_164531 [Caerostris extrusa]|uniref:Uncharacterized protein n=1 Tax=Caerostris extrusa TaxID=172846 RepID=A0AAV4W0L6_CAEEX|nr:hypothetical protein CEXT_164531 [Caerostris extrusa]
MSIIPFFPLFAPPWRSPGVPTLPETTGNTAERGQMNKSGNLVNYYRLLNPFAVFVLPKYIILSHPCLPLSFGHNPPRATSWGRWGDFMIFLSTFQRKGSPSGMSYITRFSKCSPFI